MRLLSFSQLLRFLIFFHLLANSLGLFFPMFGNFFNRFRNNQNGNRLGGATGRDGNGVNVFNAPTNGNTATGSNTSSITVPMFLRNPPPQRRVDIITTLVGNGNADKKSAPTVTGNQTSTAPVQHIEVHNNVTTGPLNSTSSDQRVLSTSQRLIIPTSTSVTSSISASQQGVPVIVNHVQSFERPNTLTLPFTPNLFGMMSYVQALKDIKRNYKDQEKQRKILFHNKEGGDLMTRILRTLIQKVVNKHQKHTEFLKLKILKRQDKLQKFLQLPMVSQVVAMDQARANGGILQSLGNRGAGIIVPQQAATSASQVVSLPRSDNSAQTILSSFIF